MFWTAQSKTQTTKVSEAQYGHLEHLRVFNIKYKQPQASKREERRSRCLVKIHWKV